MRRRPEIASLCMAALCCLLIIWSAVYDFSFRRKLRSARLPADSVYTDTIPAGPSISIYDSLVQVHADSAGLDWMLLSAVIFHESGFDNDVVSHAGAEGLMQLMPVISEKMGVEDAGDPSQNIRAGAMYLRELYDRFTTVVPDSLERYKFMLAAYNAGYGRVWDCIRYARYRGVDPSVWEQIAGVLPDMAEDSVFLASGDARLGRFSSTETVSFVRKVMKTYGKYQRSSVR